MGVKRALKYDARARGGGPSIHPEAMSGKKWDGKIGGAGVGGGGRDGGWKGWKGWKGFTRAGPGRGHYHRRSNGVNGQEKWKLQENWERGGGEEEE